MRNLYWKIGFFLFLKAKFKQRTWLGWFQDLILEYNLRYSTIGNSLYSKSEYLFQLLPCLELIYSLRKAFWCGLHIESWWNHDISLQSINSHVAFLSWLYHSALLQFFVRLLARSKISGFRGPTGVPGTNLCFGFQLGFRVPTGAPGYRFGFRIPTCVLYQHILWVSLMFTIKLINSTRNPSRNPESKLVPWTLFLGEHWAPEAGARNPEP